MPAYVYRCQACHYDDIEVVHSILEDPLLLCAWCGWELKRVPQAPGISLKGTGWASRPDAEAGVEGKVPPARPQEFGGTLDTGRKR
jgi:putative FmdB family regulatory protein